MKVNIFERGIHFKDLLEPNKGIQFSLHFMFKSHFLSFITILMDR